MLSPDTRLVFRWGRVTPHAKSLSFYAKVSRPTIPRVASIPQSTAKISGVPKRAYSQLPQVTDLLELYRSQVALGRIQFDEDQVRVVMELRKLHKQLVDYAPPALTSHYLRPRSTNESDDPGSPPWWSSKHQDPRDAEMIDNKTLVRVRTHAEDLANLTTPKGLLLTGPPGSGKSFLVDLWYHAVPTPYKTRKHYSQLVLEIYRAVWEETQIRMANEYQPTAATAQPWNRSVRDRWRELISSASLPIKWTRRANMAFSSSGATYPHTIAFAVAQRLILRHWLLVFDEVQLLDVSSATLLADVLSWFWRMGGVIVGTSNKVPDDLYKNGVQRERLEPFVEAMKVRCPVITMRNDQDWRQIRAEHGTDKTWYTWDQLPAFERKLEQLCADEHGPQAEPRTMSVFGRTVHVPWTAGQICKFTFSELCEQSLGPADYLTIASAFNTVIITSIPVLKLSAKNEARRFISLIDALYEARCRLVCLAEAQPAELFFPDSASHTEEVDVLLAEAVGETRDTYRPNVSSYDAPNMEEAPAAVQSTQALEELSVFSGKDEQFAFQRALSRLREMTSEGYARDERWTPLPDAERKWERSASAASARPRNNSSIPSPSRNEYGGVPRPDPRGLHGATSDFAAEAALADAGTVHPDARPEAPQLREEHVWGVRDDWGERAKAWGRGARVYERRGDR